MSKTVKAAFIAFVAMVSLFIFGAIAMAQPSHIPHEDPGTAQDGLMAHSVFDAYSTVFQLVSAGDFDSVSSVIGDLEGLELPEQIQDSLDLYRELVSDISGDIEDIGLLLDEAEIFKESELFAKAEEMLEIIGIDIDLLNIKTADLSNATEDLKHDLSEFIVNSSLFQSVYDNYLLILEEVDALNATYEQTRQDLEDAMQSDGDDTAITLSVSPDEDLYVGDQVTLSGRLTYGADLPLADREVKLYLDTLNQIVAVQTGADGYYSGEIAIPYDFKPDATLNASYAPTPVVGSANYGDFDKYKSSYGEIEIDVHYYDSELTLNDPPATMLAGYGNIISGSVSSEEGASVSAREIHFYLNRDLITTCLTDIDGDFSVAIEPAADFTLGSYTLRSVVLPDNDSKSNGKATSYPIELIRVTPTVQLNTPGYIISSMPRQLSGNVSYQQQPVADADVLVFFGDTLYEATTDEQGDFDVMLGSPALSLIMGNQGVSILVEPSQDWLNSVIMESRIVSLSVVNMSYFSVFMVAMGVMMIRRRKNPPVLAVSEEAAPDEGKPGDAALLRHREGVLAAYYAAAAIVGELSGIKLEASITLREYLGVVNLKAGILRDSFTELTHMAEISLYAVKPPKSDPQRAEQLLNELKGGLISEPA